MINWNSKLFLAVLLIVAVSSSNAPALPQECSEGADENPTEVLINFADKISKFKVESRNDREISLCDLAKLIITLAEMERYFCHGSDLIKPFDHEVNDHLSIYAQGNGMRILIGLSLLQLVKPYKRIVYTYQQVHEMISISKSSHEDSLSAWSLTDVILEHELLSLFKKYFSAANWSQKIVPNIIIYSNAEQRQKLVRHELIQDYIMKALKSSDLEIKQIGNLLYKEIRTALTSNFNDSLLQALYLYWFKYGAEYNYNLNSTNLDQDSIPPELDIV